MPTAADILDQVQTGDLILCHGSAKSSEEIELLTHSPYSHAAMIVLLGPDRKPFVWEEVPQSLAKDPDHNDEAHSGAQLGEFCDIVEQIYLFGDIPYWRPLVWNRPPDFDAQVAAGLPPLDGIPFDKRLLMLEHWLEGRLHIPAPRTSMYCAELVALTFQNVGLLPKDPPSNWYSPGSFGGTPPDAPLRLGATLGETVLISRTPDVDLTQAATAPATGSADPAGSASPGARTT